MPGIAGLITSMPRQQAEEQIIRMVKSMHHDPSYSVGTWCDEASGVYLGWVNRKDSFSDAMPLVNEKGDVVLVFCGEEFPEPGTSQRLRTKGHDLKGDGAEYLVHWYEDSSDFPRCLNGRFHGIVVDRRQGTIKVFNDRYGVQRLYFHEAKDAFYCAAEAKAILAVKPELRRADPQGLGEMVASGCVLENRTVFQGIQVLPPASCWTFRDRTIQHRGTYFDPTEWENQERLDAGSYYTELREVFAANLPRYFRGNEPIGMSLTGGLDTRMIVAWHKAEPGTLPCYTFGGGYRDCQDVTLARQVARTCGQSYEVIRVGKDFLADFAHYAERTVYLTDGCASVRCASDLYANERAAAIAPVRMTGNYGSEVLRRLPSLQARPASAGLYREEFLKHVQAAQQTHARAFDTHALSFIAFCQVPWHHYGLLSLEQTKVSLRSPYLDNDLVRVAYRAPNSFQVKSEIFEDKDDAVRLIGEGNPALLNIRTDRGLAGGHGPIYSGLTRNWLELTFKADYAYDYGMPQWMAQTDHWFSALQLERLFLGRHKFNHYRVWYRDTLSSYVKAILLDPRALSRPYLNGSTVERMVNKHVSGTGNYTTEIHQLLTLELLHRLFLDSGSQL